MGTAPNFKPLPPEVKERFVELRPAGPPVADQARWRRLLVRAPNWLGDAVMSLPVLAGLQQFCPQAEITVLARSRVAPLFQGQPQVAKILEYPGDRRKWQVLWSLRGRFDLAVALPNSLESALGLWLAGVPRRLGYSADARRIFLTRAVQGQRRLAGLHTVFYYLGLLTALGEVQDFSYPELSLNAQEQKAAAALLSAKAGPAGQPWVGLSPGAAYGPAKRWPAERFAALAEELSRQWGANLVLLGGPEDQAVAAEVQRHCRVPLANLTGRTSLRQALGVLRQLRLLITNDSGLMHAAAALMVPLVALFGSTDPAATGPFTEKATVLHHPLPCAPCLKRTCDLAYQCLTAISVAEVSAAARPWLEENP